MIDIFTSEDMENISLCIFQYLTFYYIINIYIYIINIYIYIFITHCAHAHCLQFEHSGNGLMSHICETSKVTINTSYFHPAHQHYTDEAQKAETVPSVVIYVYIYI